MTTQISFDDLAAMPFFEGLVTLALVQMGDLTLMVGEQPARSDQLEKMVDEIVRTLRLENPVRVLV